jgi:hypothetical protein
MGRRGADSDSSGDEGADGGESSGLASSAKRSAVGMNAAPEQEELGWIAAPSRLLKKPPAPALRVLIPIAAANMIIVAPWRRHGRGRANRNNLSERYTRSPLAGRAPLCAVRLDAVEKVPRLLPDDQFLEGEGHLAIKRKGVSRK